jgi:hypothetical protein
VLVEVRTVMGGDAIVLAQQSLQHLDRAVAMRILARGDVGIAGGDVAAAGVAHGLPPEAVISFKL